MMIRAVPNGTNAADHDAEPDDAKWARASELTWYSLKIARV